MANASEIFTDGPWMVLFPTLSPTYPDRGTFFTYNPEFVKAALKVCEWFFMGRRGGEGRERKGKERKGKERKG